MSKKNLHDRRRTSGSVMERAVSPRRYGVDTRTVGKEKLDRFLGTGRSVIGSGDAILRAYPIRLCFTYRSLEA
jgi:hypothetical protein